MACWVVIYYPCPSVLALAIGVGKGLAKEEAHGMPGIVCQYTGFEISRIAGRDRVDGASHRDGFDVLAVFLYGLQELFVSVARCQHYRQALLARIIHPFISTHPSTDGLKKSLS
jgi:hypothetical protein